MTTKVIYLNGNTITVDGSPENQMELKIPGVTSGTIIDKGIEGSCIRCKVQGTNGFEEQTFSLNQSRTIVTGEKIGSNWIREITWTPPETRG